MPDNTRTVTTRRATPAAFAAWLHAQGQQPSTHVLAWFKHMGVAWPPGAAGDDTAQTDGATALRAEDVQDFAGLVQYRLAFNHLPSQQRPEWLPEHLALVRAAVSAHGRGGKAAVSKRLGMSGQGLADLLKRHPEPVAKEASPWAGLSGRKKAA